MFAHSPYVRNDGEVHTLVQLPLNANVSTEASKNMTRAADSRRREPELNLRQFIRYDITGPARFTWNEGEGQRHGDGWTRDINQVGAYIYSANCPPAGTRTDLQVVLPPLGKAGRILKVDMDAHVLRVETKYLEQESAGFAVRCVRITMRMGGEDGSEETIEDFEIGTAGS
jgi:hypothetical protein